MIRSLVKSLSIKPPQELAFLWEQLPLVHNENAKDYNNLLSAIVLASKPLDSIDWLYLKSVVDLVWETRREQMVKAGIVKLMQREVVLELLKATHDEQGSLESHRYRIFDAEAEANRWASYPEARADINLRLANKGYSVQDIMAKAYIKGQHQIEAVDRRIAALEARKMTILREIERRNDKLAQRLEKSSADIVDAEFSEAAE